MKKEKRPKKKTQKEDEFWYESEWTCGLIIMRFVGYGLTALFIIIGIEFIYNGELVGLIPLFSSLGICMTYIKSDIQIIREKKRRMELRRQSWRR